MRAHAEPAAVHPRNSSALNGGHSDQTPAAGAPFPVVTSGELPGWKVATGCEAAETCADVRVATSGSKVLNAEARDRILALYDEYRPRLFRYLASLHLKGDSADEVIQETFTRLTAELLKASRIENVQGWIVRVAHNLAIDALKKQRDGKMATETALHVIENRPDPALTPEQVYSNKEQSRRIEVAVAELKPLYRQCFQMRAQGFRYKDIGLALGISEQRAAFVVKQAALRLAAVCG